MESVLSSSFELPTISIIGKEIQVLQIILKYFESLVVNSHYISYASSTKLEETQYNKINNLISNSNELKAKNGNYIRLKNKNNNIEYLGLSHLGKIIKINPILYNNLIVREDCILCFNETLNLLEDKEVNKKINENINNRTILDITNINYRYYLVNRKITKGTEIDNFLIDINSIIKDFLYISSGKNMIEKRLGGNEQIVIMKSNLIAFEKTVTFSKIIKNDEKKLTYINTDNEIICEGPGLIIFELGEKKQSLFKTQKIIVLTIIIIALYILEYLLTYHIKK
jgi:uncharacterized protein (AIM24 family)